MSMVATAFSVSFWLSFCSLAKSSASSSSSSSSSSSIITSASGSPSAAWPRNHHHHQPPPPPPPPPSSSSPSSPSSYIYNNQYNSMIKTMVDPVARLCCMCGSPRVFPFPSHPSPSHRICQGRCSHRDRSKQRVVAAPHTHTHTHDRFMTRYCRSRRPSILKLPWYYLSVCLSVCLSVLLAVCLSVCLAVSL